MHGGYLSDAVGFGGGGGRVSISVFVEDSTRSRLGFISTASFMHLGSKLPILAPDTLNPKSSTLIPNPDSDGTDLGGLTPFERRRRRLRANGGDGRRRRRRGRIALRRVEPVAGRHSCAACRRARTRSHCSGSRLAAAAGRRLRRAGGSAGIYGLHLKSVTPAGRIPADGFWASSDRTWKEPSGRGSGAARESPQTLSFEAARLAGVAVGSLRWHLAPGRRTTRPVSCVTLSGRLVLRGQFQASLAITARCSE